MTPPIVVCTVTGRCLPVLAASVKAYAPDTWLLVSEGETRTFGEAYNDAMEAAFRDHDEILIANDDIVLTPTTISHLMADVAALKVEHEDRLGLVATMADNVRWDQSIRLSHPHGVRQVQAVSPLLAWVSRAAFEAAKLPPLNWYSDDVMCEDLSVLGFKHFVSSAYVHHAGSQTIGHDNHGHMRDALPWLQKNRPHLAAKWMPNMVEKKLRICVYAIALNEEAFVNRFCDAASDADVIVIADTGSTDKTVELAEKAWATQVHRIHVSPWRFDTARNAALSLVPDDVDVCVSLDLDEVLQPGWREEIERQWTPGVTRMSYLFDCGDDHIIRQDKIHARKGYVWKGICHEHPSPFRLTERVAASDMPLTLHRPDTSKSRGQYLDLLFVAAADNHQDHRASFYYARELYFHQRWGHALAEFKRFLSLPSAVWIKERCYAMRMMARCCHQLDDKAGAMEWALSATEEDSAVREPWLELAMQAYHQQRWADCFKAAEKCLSISERDDCFVNDPAVWGALPHDLASVSAYHLGLMLEAKAHIDIAISMEPNNQRFLANRDIIEAGLLPDGQPMR